MIVVRTVIAIALFGLTAQPAAAQAPALSARDAAVVAIERGIWDHIAAGRWEAVQSSLDGVFSVDARNIFAWGTADTGRLRTAFGICGLAGFTIRDAQTRDVTADVVVLGYRIDMELKCRTTTSTRTTRYISTYRRRGDGWELVASGIVAAAQAP